MSKRSWAIAVVWAAAIGWLPVEAGLFTNEPISEAQAWRFALNAVTVTILFGLIFLLSVLRDPSPRRGED